MDNKEFKEIENYIQNFTNIWQKEMASSNRAIIEERDKPITRYNDSRINKLRENIDEVMGKYGAEMQDTMVRLDTMCEEFLGEGEYEIVLVLIKLIEDSFEKLHMSTSVEIRGEVEEYEYIIDKEYSDISKKWKRKYSTLPSVKIAVLNNDLNNVEQTLKKMKTQVSTKKGKLTALQSQIENEISVKEGSQRRLEEEHKRYELLKIEVLNKDKEIHKSIDLLNESKERDSSVIANLINDISLERRYAEEKCMPILQEIGNVQRALTEYKDESQRLLKECNEKKSAFERAFLFRKRKRDEYEIVHAEIIRLQQKISEAEERIAALNTTIHAIETKREGIIQEYDNEKKKWEAEKNEKIERIELLQKEIQSQHDEVERVNSGIKEIEVSIKETEKRINTKVTKLKAVQEDYEDAVMQYEAEQKSKVDIEKKIQKLKEPPKRKITAKADSNKEVAQNTSKKIDSSIVEKKLGIDIKDKTSNINIDDNIVEQEPLGTMPNSNGLTVCDADAIRLGLYED